MQLTREPSGFSPAMAAEAMLCHYGDERPLARHSHGKAHPRPCAKQVLIVTAPWAGDWLIPTSQGQGWAPSWVGVTPGMCTGLLQKGIPDCLSELLLSCSWTEQAPGLAEWMCPAGRIDPGRQRVGSLWAQGWCPLVTQGSDQAPNFAPSCRIWASLAPQNCVGEAATVPEAQACRFPTSQRLHR